MIDWGLLRDVVVSMLGPVLARDPGARARHMVGRRDRDEFGRSRSGPTAPPALAPFRTFVGETAAHPGLPRDNDLSAQVAVLVFGLSDLVHAPLPPSEIDDRIRILVDDDPAADPIETAEHVIALGVGVGRDASGQPDRWPGRWTAAVFGLVALSTYFVVETVLHWEQHCDDVACLALRVADQRADDAPTDGLATYVAMASMTGRCVCSRQQADMCNRPQEHHLAGWDPSSCGFALFVRQAVRGTNQTDLPLGRFGSGMLARPLDDEYDVSIRPTLAWTCATCGGTHERTCPRDERPMRYPRDTITVPPPKRLIVTTGACCRYQAKTFRMCHVPGCRTVFPWSATCRSHPRADAGNTTLYVRFRTPVPRELE